jgi:hypothetical protein
MKIYRITLLLLFFTPSVMYSQIANIESNRIPNDTSLIIGYFKFNLNLIQNKIQTIQFANEFHIQYKKNNIILLFVNDMNIIKSGPVYSQSYNIQHLRFNYNLNKFIVYESFLQSQYNKVLDINLRTDFGNGLRFKLKDKNFKIYFGCLLMYEKYFNNIEVCYKNGFLLDEYLSLNIHFTENIKLINTIYYQPYINDFNNFRVLDNFTLNYKINSKFSFDGSFYFMYFKKHPSIIGDHTSNEMLSIKYNF